MSWHTLILNDSKIKVDFEIGSYGNIHIYGLIITDEHFSMPKAMVFEVSDGVLRCNDILIGFPNRLDTNSNLKCIVREIMAIASDPKDSRHQRLATVYLSAYMEHKKPKVTTINKQYNTNDASWISVDSIGKKYFTMTTHT